MRESLSRLGGSFWGLVFGAALALPVSSFAAADADPPGPEPLARYPFDPVCPWGRLADGQGLIVRCLSEAEAAALAAAGPAGPAPAGAVSAEPEKPPMRVVVQSVSEAKADTGELPEARPQLSRAKDRYVECAQRHGGLEADQARVTVRFLVRERGRAEGVSVQSKQGLSSEAARCIAEVVDRRYVGLPAVPIVGATLVIELGLEPVIAP